MDFLTSLAMIGVAIGFFWAGYYVGWKFKP